MPPWAKYEKAGGPGLPQTSGRTQTSMSPDLFLMFLGGLGHFTVSPCSSLVPPSSLRSDRPEGEQLDLEPSQEDIIL